MKKTITLLVILISPVFLSWGTFGHEHINRAAVFSLPEPLRTFFYNHIDFITQESTVPDLRKYTLKDKEEWPRHFIDLESYSEDGLPGTMAEIKEKYQEEFLNKNGTLPWCIQEQMVLLTKAFKQKRKTEILFLAADLGHYLGDAHMPLHTTVNHNGQLTDQKGIHALWESHLPELFGKKYNFHTGEARFVEDVQKETWNIIFSSFKLADTLLGVDKDLRIKMADRIFKTDDKGKVLENKFKQPVFTEAYATQLHEALNGMIEKQMRASIRAAANLWYTAWVNAGKPSLEDIDPVELTNKNKKQLQEELKLWKKGRLFGIESEKEF